MYSLLTKIAIFLVLMVTGYVFAKRSAAGPEFTRALSSLVINVFMCATIINSVLTADISLTWAELGNIMLVLILTLALGYVLAPAVTKLLPVEESHRPYVKLLLAVPNNMFIALPVLDQLLGPTAVFYCGLSNIPFNLLLYTCGIWWVTKDRDGEKYHLRNAFSPPLIATLVAVLIFLLRLPVPQPLRELVSAMSGATMPLSMIVIGASLSTVSLLDAFKNWRLYLVSLFKLLIFPLLILALCRHLTDDPILLVTATIIAASPSGVMVSVLATKYGGDAIFASEGVLQNVALSMVTIPVIAYLLM